MNNFERGIDPKEGLNLGVAKEAIPINMISYWMEGKGVSITNLVKIKWFIKRFISGDLPKDPVFGIEMITFSNKSQKIGEKYDDDRDIYNRRDIYSSPPKKYEIEEFVVDYTLNDLLDKVINVDGTLIQMPGINDLKKNKLDYLLDLMEGLKIRSEDKKLMTALEHLRFEEASRIMEESEKALERTLDPKNSTNNSPTVKKQIKKDKIKSSKWWKSILER